VKIAAHILWIGLLTILTQVGGVAWLIAALSKGRKIMVFLLIYAAMVFAVPQIAENYGREPLPCFASEEIPLRAQSPMYCLLFRNYVTPELAELTIALAKDMDAVYPGTITQYLDAGLPFGQMPLLPHLSHRDGRKLDLAYFYEDAEGVYLAAKTRSPVGYWAFEAPSAGARQPCTPKFPTLRWDMAWLQPILPDRPLETARTRAMVRWLLTDGHAMGVTRMFMEPHLVDSLDVSANIMRFQGCRAARHDDHIHIEISE